jgi:hypothetical protein
MRLVLSAVALATAAAVGTAPAQAAQVCDPSKSYRITSHSLNHLVQIGTTLTAVNNTSSTITVHRSEYISGMVGMTISGSIAADAGIILASVKTTIEASAKAELTVSETMSVDVPVPPHTIRTIKFGVFRVVTTGTYQTVDIRCTVKSGTVTAVSPYTTGFIVA